MTTNKLTTSALFFAGVLVISGCGGSSSSEPDQGAALAQSASAAGTPYLGITDEELGWRAEVPETQTAALQVGNEFDFATARRTNVDLVIPEASGENAEATFCTDYTATAEGFDVNYDSCVLHAPLVGGQLNEELNLVNQYGKVLSIVWFEDPAKAPVYQEFNFE